MEKKNYYHYNTLKGLIGILKTGKINLSKESVTHKKEKPVAWISTNDFWEPTATKIVRSIKGLIKIYGKLIYMLEQCIAQREGKKTGIYEEVDIPEIKKSNDSKTDL